MAANVLQVYYHESDDRRGSAKIQKYDGDEERGSKPFTTLQIGVGDSKMLLFFHDDTGSEVHRVAEEISNALKTYRYEIKE